MIPQPSDQVAKRRNRGRSGGGPPAFDREAYRRRNTVERCINKLKVRHEVAHAKWESHEGKEKKC